MTDVKIYHNPRCSKSRTTLTLLQEQGIEPQIIDYLNTPPNIKELSGIIKLLKINAIDLVRTNETEFKSLNLNKDSLENELIKAMSEHPKLIQRPIVVHGNKAAIGRPPEAVLEIL